jgi:hypothetical protein
MSKNLRGLEVMSVLHKALRNVLLPRELTKKRKPHYKKLHAKLTARHRETQERIWHKHRDALSWMGKNFSPHHLTAGSLGSLMLLAPVSTASLAATPRTLPVIVDSQQVDDVTKPAFLVNDLAQVLPTDVRPLLPGEEASISALLSSRFGFPVMAELDGKRLNRSYGYIGAEQHLARYPGDTMYTHFDSPEEAATFTGSGMAPGLGAWGYFASSREALTEADKQREKYYIAVQTFLSPGYNEHVHEYYEFYRFRKMLVVNPDNGKAMIVVIGDAGPAQWTGKSLGGSPEVMQYLERVDGHARGPVLYFFVDDPGNTIPLGPVKVQ